MKAGTILEGMHLGVARLCLDCHEVHEYERCPHCTSEAFAFITRWIQLDTSATRTAAPPSEAPHAAEKVNAYRQILHSADKSTRARRWLRNGSLILVAGYMARWGWQLANRQVNGSKSEERSQPETRSAE